MDETTAAMQSTGLAGLHPLPAPMPEMLDTILKFLQELLRWLFTVIQGFHSTPVSQTTSTADSTQDYMRYLLTVLLMFNIVIWLLPPDLKSRLRASWVLFWPPWQDRTSLPPEDSQTARTRQRSGTIPSRTEAEHGDATSPSSRSAEEKAGVTAGAAESERAQVRKGSSSTADKSEQVGGQTNHDNRSREERRALEKLQARAREAYTGSGPPLTDEEKQTLKTLMAREKERGNGKKTSAITANRGEEPEDEKRVGEERRMLAKLQAKAKAAHDDDGTPLSSEEVKLFQTLRAREKERANKRDEKEIKKPGEKKAINASDRRASSERARTGSAGRSESERSQIRKETTSIPDGEKPRDKGKGRMEGERPAHRDSAPRATHSAAAALDTASEENSPTFDEASGSDEPTTPELDAEGESDALMAGDYRPLRSVLKKSKRKPRQKRNIHHNYFMTMRGWRPALVPFPHGFHPKPWEPRNSLWWDNVPKQAAHIMAEPPPPKKPEEGSDDEDKSAATEAGKEKEKEKADITPDSRTPQAGKSEPAAGKGTDKVVRAADGTDEATPTKATAAGSELPRDSKASSKTSEAKTEKAGNRARAEEDRKDPQIHEAEKAREAERLKERDRARLREEARRESERRAELTAASRTLPIPHTDPVL